MIHETDYRAASKSSALTDRRYAFNCAEDWRDTVNEPTLDEILADPIVHLVLGRDHLEIGDVERFLRSASRRMSERARSGDLGA